jgi:hypothetical protein
MVSFDPYVVNLVYDALRLPARSDQHLPPRSVTFLLSFLPLESVDRILD